MNYGNAKALRRHPLGAALVAALLIPGAAFAQDATTSTTAETEATNLGKVQVVGSRIKRSEIEGPSPVTVITAEQIRQEGFNTVADAIDSLSQNTGSVQNDFNAAGGFTPNASPVNLRGLGPGRTLLLINGRRANDYPFPYNGRSNFQNLNNVPAAAVERIEILSGGASAVYGSDAVAGVVNIVLKTNYEGNILKVKGQTSTDGGRDIADIQWVGGKTGDNWSVTYAFESYNAEALWGYQRDFMDSAADNPAPPGTYPLAAGNGRGGYQPPIGIQIRRLSSTGATQGYVLPAGRDCSASSLYSYHFYTSSATGANLGPGCGYDRFPAEQTVSNGSNDLSGYVYGTFNFTDNLEGWASAMAFHSRSRLGGGVEQWQGGPQAGANFYDPGLGMRIFPIRAITPESYGGSEGTYQKFEEDSLDLAFGMRGTFADRFDWEFTLGGAQYEIVRDRPRLTVAGATDYFMGSRLGTTGQGAYTGLAGVPNGLPVYRLNLDRFYGPISPADYASMSTLVHYEAVSRNASANFVLSGDLFELPAGPLSFASVVEASRQSYDLESDRRILPSVREIYNLTGTGGSGERNRYAAGVEFKVPIFSMLTGTLAGRYDKYDDVTDVDDARTWGAGLEFRPFDSLLIRANYATSFKAPDMHYVFSEPSGSFGAITDYYRCYLNGIGTSSSVCGAAGANYNYSAFTTSQGQPTLEEETGKSWTAGFVWDVTDQLSLAADYYVVELEDVVNVQSGATILEAELGCNTGRYPNGSNFPYELSSAYCQATLGRITRNPETNQITEIRSGPINQSFLGTKGVDATVRYRLDTDRFGDFSATLQWTHVLEQTQKLSADQALLSYRDLNSNLDNRSRVRLTVNWSKDDWMATVFMNRLGSTPIWDPNVPVAYTDFDTRIAPFITWNASVAKDITEKLNLRLSVVNLFDNHHPIDKTNYTYPYYWRGFDPIGRQVGLEATYKFN